MPASRKISYDLLKQALNLSRDGITIADAQKANWPLVYVNAEFERLTGYPADELLGKNGHQLLGTDTEQPEIAVLRESLQQGKNCKVTLRNYRRDGSMFWNEMSITALRDETGTLTHFIGVHQDDTPRILLDQELHLSSLDLRTLNQQLQTLAHTDPLVGIGNCREFDEQLLNLLHTAQRTHNQLSVLLLDLDQFKHFNDQYGRPAGDACLRMVGERIARSFGRASDCVARYDGDEFAVVSMGDSVAGLQQHLHKLRDQIRALNIPHTGSPQGVVTICAGGIALIPQRDTTAQGLLKQANTALQEAKHRGYDCECIV